MGLTDAARRWLARKPRPQASEPVRPNPRDVLKAATNVHLAVSSLAVAVACILLGMVYDIHNEREASHREQQLIQQAFDEIGSVLRSNLPHVIANVVTGGTDIDVARAAHGAIVGSGMIAPSSLSALVVRNGSVSARYLSEASAGSPQPDAVSDDLAGSMATLPPLQPDATWSLSPAYVRLTGRVAAVAGLEIAPSARLLVTYRLDDEALALLRQRLLTPTLAISLDRIKLAAGRPGFSLTSTAGHDVGVVYWQYSDARDQTRLLGLMLAVLLAMAAVCVHVLARGRRGTINDLISEVEAQVYDVAMRDPLTGLLNRASFKRKLEALVTTRPDRALIGVVYVDLDRFKQVNDGHGHLAGDQLLCAVTERLNDLAESGLTVARLGCDEFALLVEYQQTPEAIMRLAERACACLRVPFQLGDIEAQIGGSVGVAICPLDGNDQQELLRKGDIAMYRAKSSGRNMVVRFDATMDNDVQDRRALETDLRHALERNELSLAYQPFWASDGQTLVGTEALLRWTHPVRGPVSPALFIPIAEETGLIHDLGEWAISNAMVQARDWNGIGLAVNVSPVQFKRGDLAARIKALIASTGFEPERLEIEITEGVLMDDADAAVKFMRAFKDIGVHIALDDFGTGFSSLSYLRRFPFDKLKVDQSFVRALGSGPGTSAIIHSVIALGRALGMTVHAEGVETLEHHIFLRAAGCHHLQGFYFARPMTPAQIEALLTRTLVRPAIRRALAPVEPRDMLSKAAEAASNPGHDLGARLREQVAAMKLALGSSTSEPAPTISPAPVAAERAVSHGH